MDVLAVAGCSLGASVTVNLITEPLDRLAVAHHMQKVDYSVSPGGVRKMTSVVGTARHLMDIQGPLTFLPDRARVAARSMLIADGVRFTVADALLQRVFPQSHRNSERSRYFANHVAAGAVGGALASIASFPLSPQRNPHGVDALTAARYFRGVRYTVTPEAVYSGLYFGLFSFFKHLNPARTRVRRRQVFNEVGVVSGDLMIAMVTTFVARFVSQPLFFAADVIRYQNPVEHTGINRRYTTLYQTIRAVSRDVGMFEVFRGIPTAPLLCTALFLVTYDYYKAKVQGEYLSSYSELEDDHLSL
eukprot:TRINITY_DN5996_c0_g1_i1.p1 TRINITY_DN5996_c0_g1~~TRINITY_DN5996_c0_g1_i1.p1  ORF type:complete len:303 (+),score=78.72 TRINITY_DN5996_c0_g1_i1:85-993(+)